MQTDLSLATPIESKLLQRIAALPNTTLEPYRCGDGLHIVERHDNGVRFSGVWLHRPNTANYLQEYLRRRAHQKYHIAC